MSEKKIGVFVDSSNLYFTTDRARIDYQVLRDYALRDGGDLVRLNIYVPYNFSKAQGDQEYKVKTDRYIESLRHIGYKVIIKPVKTFHDEEGNIAQKANVDIDLVVDMLRNAPYLDKVVLASGDGDFKTAVREVQNNGCRVDVVAFKGISEELRVECDSFMSGYLIPNLLPQPSRNLTWGEEGSQVCGNCYYFDEQKKFGYMRFFKDIPSGFRDLSVRSDNEYTTAFFHLNDLEDTDQEHNLHYKTRVFRFHLAPNDRRPNELKAASVSLVI